jgi:hypothetical protein
LINDRIEQPKYFRMVGEILANSGHRSTERATQQSAAARRALVRQLE